MALTIGDNFSYQGAKPLDARLVYDTIAEMKTKADSTLYDGIVAFCKANEKNYQWKSTNEVDETLGKWREFSSGGSGEDLTPSDVEDIKRNFTVIPYVEQPIPMTETDVQAVKNAFVLN